MATMNDGNGWRLNGETFLPWERPDEAYELEQEPTVAAVEEEPEFNGSMGHSLCGCYCPHSPACPPCECHFHNP